MPGTKNDNIVLIGVFNLFLRHRDNHICIIIPSAQLIMTELEIRLIRSRSQWLYKRMSDLFWVAHAYPLPMKVAKWCPLQLEGVEPVYSWSLNLKSEWINHCGDISSDKKLVKAHAFYLFCLNSLDSQSFFNVYKKCYQVHMEEFKCTTCSKKIVYICFTLINMILLCAL